MLSNRILLVEDEPHIAEPLILALNKEGLDPTRVGTISDAREAYKNNTFDLIILDVKLPDGLGFDFCKEIRGNGDNSGFYANLSTTHPRSRGPTNVPSLIYV